MKDLQGEEHAITFTEVNLKDNDFINRLTLCIGKSYEEALNYFNRIKENYPNYTGEPEFIIDFIDSDWSIIDDFPLSKEHARHLALRMGHSLKI